ncbi:MAG: FAD-dependent oxidoreductase, partial [Pyrinomonadaceae bacterium]
VNASGAWFDRVAGKLTAKAPRRIRTTKGIHITCPLVSRRAVVLFSPVDGRLFFVIPWLGFSWIGTTDTDFNDDPAQAHATTSDVSYLLRSSREFFSALNTEDIYFSNAGVRALVLKEGSESSVSRMHRIEDGARAGARGLISVLGGKITGYRAIAEEVTDLACARLNNQNRCQTNKLLLPGARVALQPQEPPPSDIEPETVKHLFNLYGSRAYEVLRIAAIEQSLRITLAPDVPDIAAQVLFAVRMEKCLRLSDFMLRRTLLGFRPDQGQSASSRAAALMAKELGWTFAREAAELRAYQDQIAETQAFRCE